MQSLAVQARVKKISHFVQLDDLNSFRLLSVSKKEIKNLRFDAGMNILQLICFEESVKILDFLTRTLLSDSKLRFELAAHRDELTGVQAIHLAAAAGNRMIIELLIDKYGSDPREKTTMG